MRYLKALAPKKLTMILTHADADHYGGFEALIEAFGADTVYLPAYGEGTPEYAALLKAVEKSGAKTDTMTRYDVIADGSGAYLACVSPRRSDEEEGNEASSVLYLRFEGVGVMLAGDISAAVERRLVRENALMEGLFDSGECRVRLEETDILKLSHHGSASSNYRGMARAALAREGGRLLREGKQLRPSLRPKRLPAPRPPGRKYSERTSWAISSSPSRAENIASAIRT